jgi:hypothetical protein
MTTIWKRALASALCVSASIGGLVVAQPASALAIVLNNLGGVTQGTNAYLGFSAAARYWESVLTNDVTVNFNVAFTSLGTNANGAVILGSTQSTQYSVPTLGIYQRLEAFGNSALDAVAVDNLSPLSALGGVTVMTPGYVNDTTKVGLDLTKSVLDNDNSANNTRTVATAANLKALSAYLLPTGPDGTIRFSSDVNFDFNPTDGVSAGSSDFIGVAIHEMGHALGFISGVDTYDVYGCPRGPGCAANTTSASNSNTINFNGSAIGTTLDLFRYSADGMLDWRPNVDSYFSIDGGATEFLGNSNESTGAYHGDRAQASHWDANGTCSNFIGIMNPYLCSGAGGVVTAQDLGAFDAIGWNLNVDALANPGYTYTSAQAYTAAVPEPATWAMMIAGFGVAGGALRRSRRTTRVTFA